LGNLTGKRYSCATCGSEMLVTRAGDGELSCCGQPMQLRAAPTTAQPRPEPANEERKGD
jgi:desulfoferrodoxin-like iron-binding protein